MSRLHKNSYTLFGSEVTTKEAFYLVYAAHSMVNPDAAAFAEWLCAEATDFRNATKSGSQEDYEQ